MFITNDIAIAYKNVIYNQIEMKQQRNEFDAILSSLPEGILLARIKTLDEKRIEIDRMKNFIGHDNLATSKKVLPFKPQFVNSELKQVLESDEMKIKRKDQEQSVDYL